MGTASFNFSVIEKRMMTETEAASYCGLPAKHFKACCAVQAVNVGGKALRYDKRDLDQWLEAEKSGLADTSDDAIIERL